MLHSLRSVDGERTPILSRSGPEPDEETNQREAPHRGSIFPDCFEHLGDATVTVAGGAVGFFAGYVAIVGLLALRSNQNVSSDPTYWAEAARRDVYGRCYDGCDEDNFDGDTQALLACPQQACATTARVHVPNVVCDASQMWSWAERVPEPACRR